MDKISAIDSLSKARDLNAFAIINTTEKKYIAKNFKEPSEDSVEIVLYDDSTVILKFEDIYRIDSSFNSPPFFK